jgi:heptose I phosphotransferase
MLVDLPFRVRPDHREALAARGLRTLHDCMTFLGDEIVKHKIAGREVVSFSHGPRTYFLKRVSGSGWEDVLHECRVLSHLRGVDVPVPEPVACGAGDQHAALVTPGLPAERSLEDLLLGPPLPRERLRELVTRSAALLRQLHDCGVNHRDYYVGHLLVDDQDRLHLVDLGRAEIRRRVPRRRVIKDLAAFLFSVPERVVDPELRDLFLRSYLGEEGGARVKELAAAVTRKSRWMRRHAERKLARGETNIHVNS